MEPVIQWPGQAVALQGGQATVRSQCCGGLGRYRSLANDGDGTRHVMHAIFAHRSEHHARKGTIPVTADNEKVRSTGGFDQRWSRMTLDEHRTKFHSTKGNADFRRRAVFVLRTPDQRSQGAQNPGRIAIVPMTYTPQEANQ